MPPRENRPVVGIILDPDAGRSLGRAALLARIDAGADLEPGLGEAEVADRIRLARRAYFAALGRKGGRAKAANQAARVVVPGDQQDVAEVVALDPAVVPGAAEVVLDGAAASGGGDRDRAAG